MSKLQPDDLEMVVRMLSKYTVVVVVLGIVISSTWTQALSTANFKTLNSADQCAAVIVGVQCIGAVVSGTGNSHEGGGSVRSKFLSVKI